MLFNSFTFIVFLPIVFFLHWFFFGKNSKTQNSILLCASYFFYSCWDWRFLFLLLFSTLLDYFSGLQIQNAKSERNARAWLIVSIGINLGFLAFFKYYNFFITEFSELLKMLGFQPNIWTLKIILPVGISFYTFHGLSYIIDVYKKRIIAINDFVEYSLFVSYFPLLVAGPIERASHLLPQLEKKRVFDYTKAVSGSKQIIWGLFKKIVIADNCALIVSMIFEDHSSYSGSTLLLGSAFFAFQIYGDFSGYSDIASGVSKLFGIELLRNFSYPYFSRDIAEFWRRWHISLTTWFRDYLYIPLGGSKAGTSNKIRNTFIIFLVSGFWHGANWTFIFWGALNAFYFLPLLLSGKNRENIGIVAAGKIAPSLKEVSQMIFTFLLTLIAWIFFRSENLQVAFDIVGTIFSTSMFAIPQVIPKMLIVFLFFFIIIEWIGRESSFAIEHFNLKLPVLFHWIFMLFLSLIIFLYSGREEVFIYFQF